MNASITKIGARGILALALLAIVTLAALSSGEASGFTFATGSFNLKIDSKASWNGVPQPGSTWELKNLVPGVDKFFNIGDVKPGDQGEATISFHVNKDSWICLDFENLKEKENGENEPESLEDILGSASEAELADGTEFFAWHDDGDNIFEVGEKPIFGTSTDKQAATITLKNKTYVLADSLSGSAYPANQTKYIGITWCAGDMTVNIATATITCDPTSLGNEAQTDSFSVDIGFRAVPKKDNKNFRCEKIGNQCIRDGCNGSCGPTNITIINNGTVINNTTSTSNTGGNTVGGGGTVVTGNASSTSSTINIVNLVRILLGR
jgi:hypothetical protein